MQDQPEDIKLAFLEALEKGSSEARSEYLDRICRKKPGWRAELESLLKTHDEAGDFLQSPILGSGITLDSSPLSEGPGTAIDRYKLLEKIGEGGMAVVYMAEQEEPIRRKVALKIIKLGMDTRSVIARFEAERQALAMMDHPNIAKVLDAGATETGRPYFVMELVKGVPITEYCDTEMLSTQKRLDLFIQVCNAVQHAHQKGIIHRDIKPSNVMVTLHDDIAVPKVIDFGIAKAINQKLTEKTLFTRYAHIIGTPAYMSPEQAELSDLGVDTRTDIYSLGVLLYELLTGITPFSEEELGKAGYIEMQRVIREQEPTKPSTKLSTLGKTLTDIAKSRNSTPELLRKAIRGDLDWIVMKSLEKDRNRRYETANILALDIRRHIEHEPILARGPSTIYHLQKFLRRHRSQTFTVLALLVVACGATVILSLWNRDRLQLIEAEGFRHRGILSQAREQYAKADRDAALETIKPILNSGHVGLEAQLLYAGILVDNRRFDEAENLLGSLSQLDGRPEIAGAAHSLLARILWESESPQLKEIEEHRLKAEALLPETAEAYFLRAMTAITIKEQLACLDKALQLDPGHYESRRLRAFTYYASRKYEKMKEDALVMTVSRPRDPLGYSLRAIAWRELGKYAEAVAEYDTTIACTPKADTQYIDLSIQRCETLLRMGDYQRVITDAEACLKLATDNPVFRYYIFCALTALGEYDMATTLFREIVRRTPTSRNELREWCMKYVFDTLDARRSWHPVDRRPEGAAFLPMVEAEEIYRELAAKGRRLITDGFSSHWSPDGKKLAFSLGVQGRSGVAVFDPNRQETDLLIVPGKDPVWSPDGKYLAFVRDCKFLRLEDLTATEPRDQVRWARDEEVWVMNADGTKPRRLARGGSLSWGKDSAHIYFQSRLDDALCSISIAGTDVEPKWIMACSSLFPSVSPDNQRVAYLENGSLKVKDLASQAVIAKWRVPFGTWGGPEWYPTGNELCLGAVSSLGDRTGLWIYPLDANEPVKVLDSQIMAASWAPDGAKLTFGLCPPYFELWSANVTPSIPTVKALGPAQTLDEHWAQMLRLYTRRVQADPQDAYAYADRARYYDYLHEQEEARADMRHWSSILSGSDSQATTDQNIKRIINGPFNCQFVFSAERPVNMIPMVSVAFGQKGRCNMKSFRIPILSTHSIAMSLVGLVFLSGLGSPPVKADFVFGEPIHLGPPVNSAYREIGPVLSPDGLELYFQSDRPGGYGDVDIWVTRRTSLQDQWGQPSNLGPEINSSTFDNPGSLSADGLTLYLGSGWDIYTTTRATKDAPWGLRVRLGPVVVPSTSYRNGAPLVTADGLELFFGSNRPGGYGGNDIWVSTRATSSDPWETPVNLGPPVNGPANDMNTWLSPDGLTLLVCSDRPGGFGGLDMWITKRASRGSAWGAPSNLGSTINTIYADWLTAISPDGWCYINDFLGLRPGGLGGEDVWQVLIEPICDFNGDGVVDILDVGIMIEHWYTDYPLCDIGPMPLGDGFVDAKDLLVLAEYMSEEVPQSQPIQ